MKPRWKKHRHRVVKLTPDELLDLGRWRFIQFRDPDTASASMERYRRYREAVAIRSSRSCRTTTHVATIWLFAGDTWLSPSGLTPLASR